MGAFLIFFILVCSAIIWVVAIISSLTGEEKVEDEEEEEVTEIRTKEKCGKCGAPLVFDHTDSKGTIVKIDGRGQQIIRNATMSFLWVYFKCTKGCDWQLCTTSTSKNVESRNK